MKATPSALLFTLFFVSCEVSGEDIVRVEFNGDSATVEPRDANGLEVRAEGAHVRIVAYQGSPTFVLSGASDDGSFRLKAGASATVVLQELRLSNQEDCPMRLKAEGGTTVEVSDGTHNRLTLYAHTDTARHKAAVVHSKGDLSLTGGGSLECIAHGDGCKGFNVKGDLLVDGVDLSVITLGDNLGIDTTRQAPPGGVPPMEMQASQPPTGSPVTGAPPHEGMMMPPMPGGGLMPGGKQRYLSTCKAIKAKGNIVIRSGNVRVETTSLGAEGIEGKAGVEIEGGMVRVKVTDDGINSNGKIVFSGGHTMVWSVGNDAVDSNSRGDGAITISGGTVLAYSQTGPPEEAFDSDMSHITITGGTVFGVGAGMGDMGSSPTDSSSKQPSLMLRGLNVSRGARVELFSDSDSTAPLAVVADSLPFSFRNSASLLTSPLLKKGRSYVLKVGAEEVRFAVKGGFQTVGHDPGPMMPQEANAPRMPARQ